MYQQPKTYYVKAEHYLRKRTAKVAKICNDFAHMIRGLDAKKESSSGLRPQV